MLACQNRRIFLCICFLDTVRTSGYFFLNQVRLCFSGLFGVGLNAMPVIVALKRLMSLDHKFHSGTPWLHDGRH